MPPGIIPATAFPLLPQERRFTGDDKYFTGKACHWPQGEGILAAGLIRVDWIVI